MWTNILLNTLHHIIIYPTGEKMALNISDDQRFALMKFRRNVKDLLKPEHDDHYLLRWLRARNWNPDATELMFKESIKWREQWKVDTLDEWPAPEPLTKYYVSGVSGFDNEGSPVIVVPFAGLDMWGMIHSVTRSDFVRYTLRTLEGYLNLAHEQSKKHGIEARQLVAVIDMDDFNMRQYVWKPAGELVVALIKMYESNYPEILKACYIVNASRVFSIAFSLIKSFLHENTISKIHILRGDRKKFSQTLLKHMAPDQLPKYFGGTLVDENGDEKCSAMIRQGGKIPKTCYYRKPDKRVAGANNNDFVLADVKKNGKLILEFDAPTPNSVLKYEFKTEGPDVKFGIARIDEKGNETEEIPIHKVQSSKYNELGALTHDGPTKYKITFDNGGNILRSAKIHHHIQILPPLVEKKE